MEVKDEFYNELEDVFDKHSRYHMKIVLGDFIAKVGPGDIFRSTTGFESNILMRGGN